MYPCNVWYLEKHKTHLKRQMSKYILKFVKSDASVKQAYTACNLWPNVLLTALNFKISTTGYVQAFS
jgi:hypothetical protein